MKNESDAKKNRIPDVQIVCFQRLKNGVFEANQRSHLVKGKV
jgi:hypothetical protein